jgi:RNA polymerase sigma-70 factor (ECF subfamily)
LVRRAQRGDVGAFGKLYDEYADQVYGFARSRGCASHDAEDVTATVFLKAWESIGNYEERGLPFSAWLFRIARNAIIDAYRRSSRLPTPVEELELDSEVFFTPEDTVVARAEAEQVRKAVRGLTDDQAAVIALRYWWNLSLKETAETLGKNENAIKALQHRATNTLARMLDKDSSYETD